MNGPSTMVLLNIQVYTLQSAWWLLLVILLAAGITWLLYRKSAFKGKALYLLSFLRFSGLVLLLLLLLSPFIKFSSIAEEKPRLHVYLDHSASLLKGSADSFYQGFNQQFDALSNKYDLRKFYFASAVSAFKDSGMRTSATDLGEVAKHIASYSAHGKIQAVVITDGIYNKGLNPLLIEGNGNVIHSVAMGDTVQYPDIKAGPLRMNQSVYTGNDFIIESSVIGKNIPAGVWKAELLEDGKTIRQTQGSGSGGNLFQRLEFTVKAQGVGFRRYSIRISGFKGEKNMANNLAAGMVEIVNNKKQIAIVAHAAHPDIGAIRRALEVNTRFEIRLTPPGVLPESGSADVFIIHGMPFNPNETTWLKKLIGSGKSAFIIATAQSNISSLSAICGFDAGGGSNRGEENALPELNNAFDGFAIEPSWVKTFATFPPLKIQFGRYRLLSGQSVLLKQKIGSVTTDYPLQFFQKTDNKNVALLLGEGIWKWRLKEIQQTEESVVFDEWLNKTIQIIGSENKQSNFKVKSLKLAYEPDEPVGLSGEYFDKSGMPDNRAVCEVLVTGDNNYRRSFNMGKNGKFYRLEPGVLAPGKYDYVATIKTPNPLKSSGTFQVNEVSAELSEQRADHGLLRNWTAKNGGVTVKPADFSVLKDFLEKAGNQKFLREKTSITELIHIKWFFLAVLLIFSAEWFVRKYLGSY